LIALTDNVKQKTIELRKKYGLKIPDAVILAASMIMESTLLTADKDFKDIESANVIFYSNQ
jgi:predicted nucleic acid-binding protein